MLWGLTLCPFKAGRKTAGEGPPRFEYLLGPQAWARLEAGVKARFSDSHKSGRYDGEANLQANGIGRVLAWLLARLAGRPLPTVTGACAARIELRPTPEGMVWLRHYQHGDGRWETVTSIKRKDEAGRLCECAGPLEMQLVLSEAQGGLVFESTGYALRIYGRALPLPTWLSPGRIRVEHHDLGDGRFRFTLTATHPFLGRLYEQAGDFDAHDGITKGGR